MKKRIQIIAIIIILGVLLFPFRLQLKDGGSVRYKSFIYEVTKIHTFEPEFSEVKPYIDGLEIKLLGFTIYRKTNE